MELRELPKETPKDTPRENRERRRNNGTKQEGPKREAIVDLNTYINTSVQVQFIGGRQIVGSLKGFDPLMNLVLDDVKETLRDADDHNVLTKEIRNLGRVVVRGPSLLTLSPVDGSEIIENPFAAPQA